MGARMETDTTTDVTEGTEASGDAAPDTGVDNSKSATDDSTNWESEAKKWQALARKHEDMWKATGKSPKELKQLLDAEKRLAEIEESNKSEAQKLADGKAKAEQKAAEALAEAARMRAAVKHGLTEDDLELLGTGTPEEIEDRAAKLAKRIKASKTTTDFGGGNRGGDINGVKQWTQADLEGKTSDQINQARKAGHLDRLMGKTN